jgi:ribosomal protein L11 methylase PrmA
LDYGTGSGILGIAACVIGQKEQHRRISINNNVDNVDDSSSLPVVTAIGIDIDIDACRIANANAQLNGNVSMRSYLPSFQNENDIHDDESQSLLMKAHYKHHHQQQQQPRGVTATSTGSNTMDPNDVVEQNWDDIVLSDPSTVLSNESFDICVANILAGPLIVLASTLYRYLQPGGSIGMSGILSHQSAMIVETYQNVGFTNVKVHDTMNGWVLVTGQRPIV